MGPISRYLGAPDPFLSYSIRTRRFELAALAVSIMKIGPLKVILELVENEKVSPKRHEKVSVPASYTLLLLSVPVP